MEPLISIVIPCFNEELYIKDCILSLLDGAYQKIEIIVVDGESTDKTLEILEYWGRGRNWKLYNDSRCSF